MKPEDSPLHNEARELMERSNLHGVLIVGAMLGDDGQPMLVANSSGNWEVLRFIARNLELVAPMVERVADSVERSASESQESDQRTIEAYWIRPHGMG